MRAFLSWWFGHLADLLPGFVTQGFAKRADAVLLDLGGQAFTLSMRMQGAVTTIAQASADEPGLRELSRALAGKKTAPSRLFLRLPTELVLRKHLSLPAAARRDLKNLLSFEIDRETPFARDEIYWNYWLQRQDRARARLDVELFLIPRRSVDPLLEIARRVGFEPSAVEIDSGGAGTVRVSFESDSSAETRPGWPLIPRAAAACALVLAALAAPFAYQEWALASVDTNIASLKAQADEAIGLRQTDERLARAAEFFNKGECCKSRLTMLAAVTGSLPDDAYLTALTLRGNRLTMSGLSPSAALLLGSFAHSAAFRDPSFDSPVVGSREGDLERFTISVSLAQAGPP